MTKLKLSGDDKNKIFRVNKHHLNFQDAVEIMFKKCLWCKKIINNEENLNTHVRSHFEKLCCKVGISKIELNKSLISSNVLLKSMPRGKTFPINHNLKTHKRTFTAEKPHQCFECGKTFSYIRSLTVHKRTHTGKNLTNVWIVVNRFPRTLI